MTSTILLQSQPIKPLQTSWELVRFEIQLVAETTCTRINRVVKCNSWLLEVNQFTNRFHVSVRLFSNRSQMTSKCGKNKKVAHEA